MCAVCFGERGGIELRDGGRQARWRGTANLPARTFIDQYIAEAVSVRKALQRRLP